MYYKPEVKKELSVLQTRRQEELSALQTRRCEELSTFQAQNHEELTVVQDKSCLEIKITSYLLKHPLHFQHHVAECFPGLDVSLKLPEPDAGLCCQKKNSPIKIYF